MRASQQYITIFLASGSPVKGRKGIAGLILFWLLLAADDERLLGLPTTKSRRTGGLGVAITAAPHRRHHRQETLKYRSWRETSKYIKRLVRPAIGTNDQTIKAVFKQDFGKLKSEVLKSETCPIFSTSHPVSYGTYRAHVVRF
jgi:hypothetical protein